MKLRATALSRARRACAGAAFAAIAPLTAGVAAAQALPTVTFDLRVHDSGGKEAEVTNVGDSVLLDLYVITRGLNDNHAEDRVFSGLGTLFSSNGGLLGDLSGLRPPAPYDTTYQVGKPTDIDGDGDLDLGPKEPSTSTFDYYWFRVPPPGPALQPADGQFVGQMMFTLRSAADASTSINWTQVQKPYTLITNIDGVPIPYYSSQVIVNSASPVLITGVTDGGGGGPVTYLTGTHADLMIDTNTRVTAGTTLTVTQGINVVAGGTLDDAGGAISLSVNNATSGNSGGTMLVGPLNIGPTADGTFTQSGGYSRVGAITLGSAGGAGGAAGNLRVTGGKLDGGNVVVNQGAINVANGVINAGAIDLMNAAVVSVSGGELNTSGVMQIGVNGDASVVITGGKTSLGGSVVVGDGGITTPARGLFRIDAGTFSALSMRFGLPAGHGGDGGSIGHGEQNGGTLNAGMVIGSPTPDEPSSFRLTNGILNASLIHLAEHARFTQTAGQVTVPSTLIIWASSSANETQYHMSGGSLAANYLAVYKTNAAALSSSGRAGGFVQAGGDVTIGDFVVDEGGRYDAVGGTLAVTKRLRMRGILDFDGQAVPVAFGDNVFADFTKGQLLGAGGASFTGGAGSLLSFASAAQRDSVGSISTQGLVHVAGSALTIPPDQSVGGSGTIEGDVDNQGTLAPGSSPGEIVVNGAYVQEDTGRLAVEIAGTVAAEEFDLLTVNGAVSLDGLLDVALLDDFVPAASDRFVILTSTNLNGTFDNAVIATGGRVFFSGGRFDVLYGTTSVTLTNFTAVPEPAGAVAALFLAAGATIVRRPRRRPRRRA